MMVDNGWSRKMTSNNKNLQVVSHKCLIIPKSNPSKPSQTKLLAPIQGYHQAVRSSPKPWWNWNIPNHTTSWLKQMQQVTTGMGRSFKSLFQQPCWWLTYRDRDRHDTSHLSQVKRWISYETTDQPTVFLLPLPLKPLVTSSRHWATPISLRRA